MRYFLGIDLGTSHFKAGLFDAQGQMRGLGRIAVEKDEGADGCELPPERFWDLAAGAVETCLRDAAVTADEVAALGYASQANSFLLLDRCGTPLTPLVLWPDRRAADLVGGDRDLWLREDFLSVTGVGVGGPEFAPYKLEWFRQARPALWQRVGMVQTISDHFVWGLTGLRLGDRSTASLLGLWDQRKGAWWQEGLGLLGLAPGSMSEPLRPGVTAGRLTEAGAAQLGLRAGTLLVAGALDHYAAALGAGVGSLAPCSESTGTVLACVALNDRFAPRRGCCIGPTHREDAYYELAFNNCGASRLDQYRLRYAPEASLPHLLALAEAVPPGCQGVQTRIDWHGDSLEGWFLGLREDHSTGHYVRAILEANAGALAELIEALGGARRPDCILATGGGARSDLWLQIKADWLKAEVIRSDCEEPACRGGAWLAAAGATPAPGGSALGEGWHRAQRRFRPGPPRAVPQTVEGAHTQAPRLA